MPYLTACPATLKALAYLVRVPRWVSVPEFCPLGE
jgi:hypothetical protein